MTKNNQKLKLLLLEDLRDEALLLAHQSFLPVGIVVPSVFHDYGSFGQRSKFMRECDRSSYARRKKSQAATIYLKTYAPTNCLQVIATGIYIILHHPPSNVTRDKRVLFDLWDSFDSC